MSLWPWGQPHEATRFHLASRRRGGGLAARGARADAEGRLPNQTRAHHCAGRRRRSDRYCRAHARRQAFGDVGPAGVHREPAGRRQQPRYRIRGEVRSRRIHRLVRPRRHCPETSLYHRLSYDAIADFAPVSLVAKVDFFMFVPNSSPAHSLKEFVDYVRPRPGQLTMASPGTGSAPHLAEMQFLQMAGMKMTHVPYRGAAPAFSPLLPRRLHCYFATLTLL